MGGTSRIWCRKPKDDLAFSGEHRSSNGASLRGKRLSKNQTRSFCFSDLKKEARVEETRSSPKQMCGISDWGDRGPSDALHFLAFDVGVARHFSHSTQAVLPGQSNGFLEV